MENSFFAYTQGEEILFLQRLHVCMWEFNKGSLLEFGFEVHEKSLNRKELVIYLLIPWFSEKCKTRDLYDSLSISENSRFIFNDTVVQTSYSNTGKKGIMHKFSERPELCILPVAIEKSTTQTLKLTVNLSRYHENTPTPKPNVYFRFLVSPSVSHISMRKKGIGRTTVIYDIKINEKRNIPAGHVDEMSEMKLCSIQDCFLFSMLPNSYNVVFFESSSLKSIRTLESDSFNKYIVDERVNNDELIVVFNKKSGAESYSFFSIYSKERIGPGQFALAILINIFSGLLIFIPGYRKSFTPEKPLSEIWTNMPIEVYIAFALIVLTIVFFLWPSLINCYRIVQEFLFPTKTTPRITSTQFSKKSKKTTHGPHI